MNTRHPHRGGSASGHGTDEDRQASDAARPGTGQAPRSEQHRHGTAHPHRHEERHETETNRTEDGGGGESRAGNVSEQTGAAPTQSAAQPEGGPLVVKPPVQTLTPAEAAAGGQGTVEMEFPKPVTVQHNGIKVHFPRGIQRVIKELSGHWWLKANGAKKKE